jgi:hypothetical protein
LPTGGSLRRADGVTALPFGLINHQTEKGNHLRVLTFALVATAVAPASTSSHVSFSHCTSRPAPALPYLISPALTCCILVYRHSTRLSHLLQSRSPCHSRTKRRPCHHKICAQVRTCQQPHAHHRQHISTQHPHTHHRQHTSIRQPHTHHTELTSTQHSTCSHCKQTCDYDLNEDGICEDCCEAVALISVALISVALSQLLLSQLLYLSCSYLSCSYLSCSYLSCS